jgi:hypothetical protein
VPPFLGWSPALKIGGGFSSVPTNKKEAGWLLLLAEMTVLN